MCANPAVPADNHAASDNRARSDPAARTDLCSGLNHRQRSDFRGRIDERSRLLRSLAPQHFLRGGKIGLLARLGSRTIFIRFFFSF
jgi:hypothetical protein